jgi:GTPase SAR1 family protein
MEIILLAGQAGVGKSTAARVLAEEAFERGFVPVLESFAKPIKEEAMERGYDKAKFPRKYRGFCQSLGEIARQENPDHWVDLMQDRINKILITEREELNKGKKYWERVVIIDDCRYLNEVNLGFLLRATTVFLSFGKKRKVKQSAWREHESEKLANKIAAGDKDLMDIFQHVIINDYNSEENFIAKIKEHAHILLGFSVESGEECTCPICSNIPSEKLQGLKDITQDLLDLLELNEDDIDIDINDEEDDTDEEA